MDKYKLQVGVLMLAIIIGMALGAFYTGKNKNKELLELQEKHVKQLEKQNKQSLKIIKEREKKIEILEDSSKKDSLLILKLEKSLEQDGVKVEQKRKQVKNLSNEQKKQWLVDRYSTPSN